MTVLDPGVSAEELAQRYGLHRSASRPPLRVYLAKVWSRRHFTYTLARMRLQARNHEDTLGAFWNVLRPLLSAGVYFFVFGLLLRTAGGVHNKVGFICIGVFFFTFTSQCLTNGARAVTGSLGLVRALHFPRAVLPMATVLFEALSMISVVATLLAILLVTGERPSLAWLIIVPLLVVQTVFNTGLAFVAARITTHFRDFAQLLPFGTRIWFYLSGVFYDLDRFKKHPGVVKVLETNPAYDYVHIAREALLYDRMAAPKYWVLAGAWAVAFCLIGLVFFWKAEERYGRE